MATYCRTNLTMRQLAPLFGLSRAAVGRIIDRHGPLLALPLTKGRPSRREVLIVDGALVPTGDRTVSASSKNYRYSANLQVLVKADTRLVLASAARCRATAMTAPPLPSQASKPPAAMRSSLPAAAIRAQASSSLMPEEGPGPSAALEGAA